MPQSLVSCYLHCIFSTKDRRPLLVPDVRDRLWPYLGGIARTHEMRALEIGGTDDHVHLLLSLPATMAVAKAMQLLKGGSSKWAAETLPHSRQFSWQKGYAAFSVGYASLNSVHEYIREQETHHRRHTFQEEVLAFLQRYGIEYDERYLWD